MLQWRREGISSLDVVRAFQALGGGWKVRPEGW